MKKILLAIIVIVLMAQFAVADGLIVDSIRVYVNGDKESGIDEDGGSIDNVEPDSTIEVRVKIKNDYPRSSDEEIENIFVLGTIEGIDDGDDFEEESDDFDLDAGDSETITLEYEIPLEVEEDTYSFPIIIEGENSTDDYYITVDLEVEIEKENHELRITRADLSPETITCSGSASLDVKVVNTGADSEDDVKLSITNDALNVNREDTFDLDNDPFDSDSWFSQKYSINVPEGTSSGMYPVLIKALYYDEREEVDETVMLTVEGCKKETPVVEDDVEEEEVEPEQEVIIETEPAAPVITAAVAKEPTFMEGTGGTVLIVIGYIIVIAIGAVIVMNLFKRD